MAQLEDEASHSPRPLPDLIGGRYRIVSRLGVGGMGVVYKATDIQLKRSVAIKALEERRLHIPGAATRLKNEALAAASLDHPTSARSTSFSKRPPTPSSSWSTSKARRCRRSSSAACCR
jgi:serine/threonine protein kinase